ncbi:MAG TPA: hypothetical protein VFG37_06885 [Planctomycetota bacterium]|nr:hypothetical protein [Planctomycetota bacterium]
MFDLGGGHLRFMEAGNESVSIDLLVHALLAMGASLNDLADVIRSAGRRSAA